ncbi:MAG TPA: TrpB-like pyridoxal phosphate-dependent enzyme [bacterium]|nr:TrpB-like pyridoxal phosphate-dependent enzyme [bacterium]
MDITKVVLAEDHIPKAWYNIRADLPVAPAPVLHPGTRQPISPTDLEPLFPPEIILQEVSTERYVDIPREVYDIYRLWRPTPLYRARRLEQALHTPAHIYYKYEGVSPAGSHKPNTAVAQAFYNKQAGVRRLATETGAGQWGSALALASRLLGLECTVYMVRVSFEQKPYRRVMMETWGAEVLPSPSPRTAAGRAVLERDPQSLGSLGIAISEAAEDAATHGDAKYSLGSVLNHVLMHQTVIGLEAKSQMEAFGEYPDVVIGCCGGGSNLAGLSFPFLADTFKGKSLRVVAVEPTACPTLTRGKYLYDFGDEAETSPLLKMYTLGHKFVPAGIHAGGLRYHGDAPLICLLYAHKYIEAVAYPQIPVFAAAVQFARTEGILPAPESAHAILKAIDEALEAKEAGEARTILFNLSGHGHFDLGAYQDYVAGQLKDYAYPEAEVEKAMAGLTPLQP